MQRIIREEEPAKPSTKLSTLGETLTDIAKRRGCTPDLLERAVRGDLDWIVMKALEKDRARRYGGASDFALDIERHLKHRPVLAHAPSTTYRMHKFVQRSRVPILVTSIIAVFVVVLSTVLFTWSHKQQQWSEENLSRHRQALSEAERAFDLGELAQSLMQAKVLLDSKYVKSEAGILVDHILTRARDRVGYYTDRIESAPEDAKNHFRRAEYYDLLDEEDMVRSDVAQYTAIASRGWSSDLKFGAAENLGPIINTPLNDVSGSISTDGLSLIFARGEIPGYGDFCMASRSSKAAAWDTPKTYGSSRQPDVNLPINDVTSWWTADGLEMPVGQKRFDGYGGIDIWMYQRKLKSDNWGPLKNLGCHWALQIRALWALPK